MDTNQTKYERIYEFLHKAILEGTYKKGDKLPSELDLAKQFHASRPTVAKSFHDLSRAGLVERKVGSGTYVKYDIDVAKAKTFGLMLPGLNETEIFEPICAHMSHVAEERNISLLWGRSISDDPQARRDHALNLAQRYIQKKVDGVFFTPLELTCEKDTVNKRTLAVLAEARMPVVLLDRDVLPFPRRSQNDIVSIDNFHVAYTLAHYLIECGYKRIDFMTRPLSASSVDMRINAYQQTLRQAGIGPRAEWVHVGQPDDLEFVKSVMVGDEERAFMCANDTTAAILIQSLELLGVKIPEEAGIVGVDDIRSASHLKVPLTTYRQPCEELARLAIETMLARAGNPGMPIRTVSVMGELVIRESVKQPAVNGRTRQDQCPA